jgi:hypothetical protein
MNGGREREKGVGGIGWRKRERWKWLNEVDDQFLVQFSIGKLKC